EISEVREPESGPEGEMGKKKKPKPQGRGTAAESGDIHAILRAAGLKVTLGRIAVFQFLLRQDAPLTHAEVVAGLQKPAPDGSTIFRALNDLADAGLIRRLELGDHAWRYEARNPNAESEANGLGHPHFLCLDCGGIVCLGAGDVRWLARSASTDKRIGDVTEVLLKGHCRECR
ncbi:MAG: Fur family transcriptional regulator, partial [Planctomycetota bacterium]